MIVLSINSKLNTECTHILEVPIAVFCFWYIRTSGKKISKKIKNLKTVRFLLQIVYSDGLSTSGCYKEV